MHGGIPCGGLGSVHWPSGAEARVVGGASGTAEAVPFHETFYEIVPVTPMHGEIPEACLARWRNAEILRFAQDDNAGDARLGPPAACFAMGLIG